MILLSKRLVNEMSVKANAENFDEEIESGIVAADFYSDSCVPCKRMSPILAEIEDENNDVKLLKVNVNFDGSLAEKYEVQAVPTLIFFKDGAEIDRIIGTAKKAEILEIINKLR